MVFEERTLGTTITVRWERPEITGRDDFYYNIFYSEDNHTFTQHNDSPYNKQDAVVDYSVSGLHPLTTYTVRVSPENRVSGQEGEGGGQSCEVVVRTGDTSEWINLWLMQYTLTTDIAISLAMYSQSYHKLSSVQSVI